MLRFLLLALTFLSLVVHAAPESGRVGPYSDVQPTANDSSVTATPRTRLLWGDTHVHTTNSGDSLLFGNRLTGPDDAYRFARGEVVESNLGKSAQLETPLDFLLVSNHAETLGTIWRLHHPGDYERSLPQLELALAIVRDGLAAIPENASLIETVNVALGSAAEALLQDYENTAIAAEKAWASVVEAAERHNDPGKFTTLIGYEWSSTPDGDNLHRVVMYRDGGDKALQTMPVSTIAGMIDPAAFHPESLWTGLAAYEEKTGGQILAIPHNSNLSSGLMFDLVSSTGPMDEAYAATRMRWEPVVEATQIKGDSEAHPFLSPEDEFADYENWDRGNIFNTRVYDSSMLAGSYVREGLKRGLKLGAELGTNPYQFGVIGSTDSHTGLATADSNNYWGKSPLVGPTPKRLQTDWSTAGRGGSLLTIKNTESAASGFAAVWATDNTREAIFDAFKRREVYATTGPRIQLRFFGGYHYSEGDLHAPDFAAAGYAGGVPMGGELAASDSAPIFLVSALKDPVGANLDRVQIVKGWLDAEGQLQERIYDVALSGDRKVNRAGRAKKDVGNTVDLEQASYSNAIGEVALAARWQDPDFDPGQPAFYYVRVLEIPTPRWTTYDAAGFGIDRPDDVPAITRERAYSSAIWYTP